MIETSCARLDCFFWVKGMCCNLCADGKEPCDLYWRADKKPGVADGETSPPLEHAAA